MGGWGGYGVGVGEAGEVMRPVQCGGRGAHRADVERAPARGALVRREHRGAPVGAPHLATEGGRGYTVGTRVGATVGTGGGGGEGAEGAP